MSIQVQQKHDFDQSASPQESIQPVTIANEQEEGCLSANKFNQVEDAEQIDICKEQISLTNSKYPDYYQDHKSFLENYKKQRQEQLRESTNEQLPLTEQVSEDQEEAQMPSKLEKLNSQMISQRMGKIHTKLRKELINMRQSRHLQSYKIFTDSVESKKDIQRVTRQKRFIRSQQSKNCNYQEPSMPVSKRPIQLRGKSQSIRESSQLQTKAKRFIHRIQHQQQNLLGRLIVRKKKEENRKLEEQAERARRQHYYEQIKREERRLKAEQNLLILKEKSKLGQIVNRTSLQELRKALEEKQLRLQHVRQSLRRQQQQRSGSSLRKHTLIPKITKKNKNISRQIQKIGSRSFEKRSSIGDEDDRKINIWLQKRWKNSNSKQANKQISSSYDSVQSGKQESKVHQQNGKNQVVKIDDSASLPRQYKYSQNYPESQFSQEQKSKRIHTEYIQSQKQSIRI